MEHTYQFESTSFLVSKGIFNYLCRMKTYKLNGTIYYCPVDLTLSVIGGRWQGLIMWALREKAKRFNEIKRELVTINDKVLSQTLKKLVEQGVLNRKSYNEIPPKVEYSLTETGKQLQPMLKLMEKWGNNNAE